MAQRATDTPKLFLATKKNGETSKRREKAVDTERNDRRGLGIDTEDREHACHDVGEDGADFGGRSGIAVVVGISKAVAQNERAGDFAQLEAEQPMVAFRSQIALIDKCNYDESYGKSH